MLKRVLFSPGVKGGLTAMLLGLLFAGLPWLLFGVVLFAENGSFGCEGDGASCGLVWVAIFASFVTVPIGAAIALAGFVTALVGFFRRVFK